MKNIKKMVYSMLLIMFIIIFLLSLYNVLIYFFDKKENVEILQNISNYIGDYNNVNSGTKIDVGIDFDSLKKINSDTIGFIDLNETDVKFVVVNGNDNDYYLTHNFYKKNNKSGWIFADYKNKIDGSDKNIVIYGHNMKNGTMFSKIEEMYSSNCFSNFKYITFATEYETNLYEIFSVYQIENENYYATLNFKTDIEFDLFLKKIKKRSLYNFDIEVNSKDKIITLSTCGYDNDHRIVIHAVKL